MKEKPSRAPSRRTVFYVVLIYALVVIVFTLLGMLLSPLAAQVGGTRPDETIPAHVAELGLFGLLLGIMFVAIAGRSALPLVVATPIMTALLDADHLPAYLGYAQPIRPAHSLIFLVVVLAIVATTIKALDMDLIVMSAFLGHLAIDSGQFAPFSPINFSYFQLDPFNISFGVCALLCAVAAGLVWRSRLAQGAGT